MRHIRAIIMGIFNFYLFFSFFGPFFDLFWPLVIFGVKFLYIVLCTYINCVYIPKITLINGISMGIFDFNFFFTFFGPFFDPFLAFGYIWGQIPIDYHMCIYKLCKDANNCTHKWYFYEHLKFLPFYLFWTLFWPFFGLFLIWGQIPIDCHMCIYKLCKHAKNCTHKCYFYGHF